jgi:hypothetical protein
MDQFINRFARSGLMKLSEFIRELRSAGFNHWRSDVVAELSRRGFTLSSAGGQTWIVGLSLTSESKALRAFIDTHCVRSDGLSCKLSAIVKATGLKRTEVIETLSQWGFDIKKHNGAYVVAGIGTKEVYA